MVALVQQMVLMAYDGAETLGDRFTADFTLVPFLARRDNGDAGFSTVGTWFLASAMTQSPAPAPRE